MSDPEQRDDGWVRLDVEQPIWHHFFTVAPLVLIGTREEDGAPDLAPKHMVTPLSWENWVGFVCSPRHGTYHNAQRDGSFTMSWLRPEQILEASLAAAPREEDASKPALAALPTLPASQVPGVLVAGAYLHLECALDRVVDGFGDNSLMVGRIVAAQVHEDALRGEDRDDNSLVHETPLLAYLHPGRFARIDDSQAFPFHAGFKR